MDTYTVLSLFSGIGGLDLGVRQAVPARTIAYVEREITAARVLAARAEEGLLDEAPIYADIESFPAERFAGKVDGIIGGFPCQPFSVAGKRRGSEDERNMWPDTIRVIREIRPRFECLENVAALTSNRYFGTILGDLAEAGFDAEWGRFTASEVGTPHKRERVFILAHAAGARPQGRDIGGHGGVERAARPSSPPLFAPFRNDTDGWSRLLSEMPQAEPAFCGASHGSSNGFFLNEDRVDRLRALGNMVVPLTGALAFVTLSRRAKE